MTSRVPAGTLRERILSFPRWHYRFVLDGVETPVFRPENVNRHEQRRRHVMEPLLALLGGSLAGRRVLDLGCNAGFWSLAAIEAGCDAVLGVDGREMHVAQAELVFDARGVPRERYRFVRGDVLRLDLKAEKPFDVVLCLGLLYHVNQPVQLLELCAAAAGDLLVIDTTVTRDPRPVLELVHDDLADPRNALASPLVFFPSAAAVVAMVRALGFHGVVLAPRFSDYTGCEDFLAGRRRVFLCARDRDLSALSGFAESAF